MLWKNFAILPATTWFPSFTHNAGLPKTRATISALNWSYGWVAKPQIMDVVVHYRLANGAEGVIVIEAKTPWEKALKGKDLDPSYYLDHPRLNHFAERTIVYLLDESLIEAARTSVNPDRQNVGFLSWQQLADIQISTCANIDAPVDLQSFVGAAIHRQFSGFHIIPSASPASYLLTEPFRLDVDAIPNRERQSTADREHELWRLQPWALLAKHPPGSAPWLLSTSACRQPRIGDQRALKSVKT